MLCILSDHENNIGTVTDVIQEAIAKINEMECVSLVEYKGNSPNKDYVVIKLGQDYSSHLGHQGGPQDLTVVAEQIDTGSVMHELMHSLGMSRRLDARMLFMFGAFLSSKTPEIFLRLFSVILQRYFSSSLVRKRKKVYA